MTAAKPRSTPAATGSAPRAFGSRPDRLDRRHAVFGEVLESLDHLVAGPADDGQSSVSECSEHLRCVSGMSACLVLATGDIAHVMKLVLYPPVFSRQRQQFSRTSLLRGMT